MKKMITLRALMAVAAVAAISLTLAAHDGEGPDVEPSMLYAPLVYDNYSPATHPTAPQAAGRYALDAGDEWLQEAIENTERTRQVRQRAMIENPQLVAYNANRLPEPPPEGVIEIDPKQGMLTVAPAQVVVDDVTPPDAPPQPLHNWLHVFNASLQFTQA